MQNSKKKGFSLVELLVAMAIIAVLISIAAFGIQIVQRNARNTKRRKVVEDLQLLATDIQTNEFTYPGGLLAAGGGYQFSTAASGGTNLGLPYELKGFTQGVVSGNCAAGTTGVGEEANANNITICFDATQLKLGVLLEGTTTGYVTDI